MNEEFKIGDKVKIICQFQNDDIFTIIDIKPENDCVYIYLIERERRMYQGSKLKIYQQAKNLQKIHIEK